MRTRRGSRKCPILQPRPQPCHLLFTTHLPYPAPSFIPYVYAPHPAPLTFPPRTMPRRLHHNC
eukprot:1063635-Prorocentrum_lima.AAC.1